MSSLCGSHMIDPALLRADQFEAFMSDRQRGLLALNRAGDREGGVHRGDG